MRRTLSHWWTSHQCHPAEQRAVIAQTLNHWTQDADLASVRGEAIESLPESERAPWLALWPQVESLRDKAQMPADSPTNAMP